jgi:hypothetical protein
LISLIILSARATNASTEVAKVHDKYIIAQFFEEEGGGDFNGYY